jgi:hypothetical protein
MMLMEGAMGNEYSWQTIHQNKDYEL